MHRRAVVRVALTLILTLTLALALTWPSRLHTSAVVCSTEEKTPRSSAAPSPPPASVAKAVCSKGIDSG